MVSKIKSLLRLIFSPRYTVSLIKRYRLQKKFGEKHLTVGLKCEIMNSNIGEYIYLGSNVIIRNSSIGDHSYLNSNNYINDVEIGKFCSIATNVLFGLGKHPTNMVSTHPAFYANNKKFKTFSKKLYVDEHSRITIGNDVWIGEGVVIMDGVAIGDGAIVAARAVVTKDVEPYAIVGGIPAKLIKYRFDKEIIEKLRATKWWDNIEEWFESNYKIFLDPKLFLSRYNDLTV